MLVCTQEYVWSLSLITTYYIWRMRWSASIARNPVSDISTNGSTLGSKILVSDGM